MRAAIYCRVSTREQAESGYSIPDQVRNCRLKARELGATVIEEFIDNESGAFLERPGLEKLRHALKQKCFDLVITKSPDRLSRNITHQLILREEIIKSGAELKFLTFEWQNTPDGRLLMNVQGVISDYEREVIRERTMMGRRSKVLAGKIPLNSHVYGYLYDKKRNQYCINEEEARVVRNIYQWLLQGDGLNGPMGGAAIAKKLAEEGIKPPRRAKNSWARATVYKILKNPIYTGTAYFYKEKKRKTGLHTIETTKRPASEWLAVPVPPIITKETFESAQTKLRENARNNRRNTKHKYLLQGLVFCGFCGRRMSINPARMRNNKKVPAYYVCPKNQPNERRYYVNVEPPIDHCPARTIPLNILETQVWLFVSNLISCEEETIRFEIEKIYKNNVGEPIDGQLVLDNLKRKEDTLIHKRKKIAKWFREELITELEAEKELEQIKMDLLEVSNQRRKLQAEILNINNNEKDIITGIVKQIKSINNPEILSFDAKRNLLKYAVKGIHVKRTDNARGYGASRKIKLDICLDLRPQALT